MIDERFNVVHGSDLSDKQSRFWSIAAQRFITAEAEMQFGFGYPITRRVIAAGVSGDMFSAMRQTLQMQRGNALLYEMTEESQASARTLFERAIELDPDFS